MSGPGNGPYGPPANRSEFGPVDDDGLGEPRDLILGLRQELDGWRRRGYRAVTPTSRKLLLHWADPDRDNRPFFCQREAAETAIFLAEASGRAGFGDWHVRLDAANAAHNSGLPRRAFKLAAGSGKSVVMAMLIAWQTLNQLANPRDPRFARHFLLLTPGLSSRDQLSVVFPNAPGNCYDERDLVPADLRAGLARAEIIVTNYHALRARDSKMVDGVAAATRRLLLADRAEDPFRETPAAVLKRVLRDFDRGRKLPGIVVFNDEAQHCYRDRPDSVAADPGAGRAEDKNASLGTRAWYRGLRSIARGVEVKVIYDLTATPYYGSGPSKGAGFGWTVSDFSLSDAIEAGIAKLPRLPRGNAMAVDPADYPQLWDRIGAELPKEQAAAEVEKAAWKPPAILEDALRGLYASYRETWDDWANRRAELGELPPVFAVLCPSGLISRLVFGWIAGRTITAGDRTTTWSPGNLELFGNSPRGARPGRPATLLLEPNQLESGEHLRDDFRVATSAVIDALRSEAQRRSPGADVDRITGEALLREAMNTVGEAGGLGETVRCVVSNRILPEGWDASAVTHLLAIGAFESPWLCEQAIGPGLRRRSYAIDDDGQLEPEYVEVYGVPLGSIGVAQAPALSPSGLTVTTGPAAVEVASVAGRERLRISFPKLDGYRLELPDDLLDIDTSAAATFRIGSGTGPAGPTPQARDQQVEFALARQLLDSYVDAAGGRRPWLFPQLLGLVRGWIRDCVEIDEGYRLAQLLLAEPRAVAAEQISRLIRTQAGVGHGLLRPMLRPAEPIGSTAAVRFRTRRTVVETIKSEVSHVVLDARADPNWDRALVLACERPGNRVAGYAKNDRLGFSIPYLYRGRTHSYAPDFLLRLDRADGEDFDRFLIVDAAARSKGPGPMAVKAATTRDSWCPAVNNTGTFGRWGYLEISAIGGLCADLDGAIDALYADTWERPTP